MLGTAIIVFRETLEAALFVGIIAAATRGLVGRSRWLTAGVLAGSAGALVLAAGAEHISALADGVGQDLLNAGILAVALAMLTWHCVWASNRGAQAAAEARALGSSFKEGQRAPWALMIVVALSVLRDDLIAWCPAAFMPESQDRLRALPINKIEVSLEEAVQAFACNLVSTGETVIMSAQAPNFKAAVEAYGLKTITPIINELAKGGGYIRCISLTLDNA